MRKTCLCDKNEFCWFLELNEIPILILSSSVKKKKQIIWFYLLKRNIFIMFLYDIEAN